MAVTNMALALAVVKAGAQVLVLVLVAMAAMTVMDRPVVPLVVVSVCLAFPLVFPRAP